ncbi:hypothetical protein M3A49_30620 [Paraburkholderia sp. CNPSo 3076]|uniref:hypothetical protein n=1 Tax=Paraburkholderia sp. CNPSo 3076 TaxID=2940936 RepID=UPI0022578411|nr:hypothetical protein [Paraburkholderia sp. CNPSo 3076]MCX5543786.1 hypothetical protein [Paraburkholderia sp. CNPSo 3076]
MTFAPASASPTATVPPMLEGVVVEVEVADWLLPPPPHAARDDSEMALARSVSSDLKRCGFARLLCFIISPLEVYVVLLEKRAPGMPLRPWKSALKINIAAIGYADNLCKK